MGDGSILIRMSKDEARPPRLALEADRERFAALMAVVGGQPLPVDAIRHIEAANDHWRRGDKTLANLRLMFAHLPRIDTSADASRLTLAEYLLDEGMSPAELMEELGFSVPADLEKYSQDQPRVPAGHGRASGQFGSGGGSHAFLPPAALAPSLSPATGIAVAVPITGLLAFAVAMVIPTPNSGGIDEGKIRDMPDVHYRKDGPAGTLKLMTTAPDGSDVTVLAHNRNGTFVDSRTDREIGRDLGTSMALDKPAVRAAIDAQVAADEEEEPDRKPRAATDEPEVCPAPEPDTPHGSSDRAKDYEEDVHARVNPSDPTRRGYAYRVIDPLTGRPIFFDDCFRNHGDLVDGDMKPGDLVEAKGQTFEYLISQGFERPVNDFIATAEKQMRAANARGVGLKWYFAERSVADLMRKRFGGNPRLEGIVVSYMPPHRGKQ